MKIHYEEKIILVMETPPKLHNERILRVARHTLEHSLFREGVLKFLVGKHMTFGDSFQRVQ
jgi:hypothetical protein